MSQLTVAKFGGTSVRDAAAMRRCAAIVLARPETRVVVVSATSGTTNRLIELVDAAAAGDVNRVQSILLVLREHHVHMARELGLSGHDLTQLHLILDRIGTLVQGVNLLGEASARVRDNLVGQGERLSAILFARALMEASCPAHVFPAERLIRTNGNHGAAEVDVNATREQVQTHLVPLLNDALVVTQGFIGGTVNDVPTTLGRGGSDYSAALLAEALDAEAVHIWTDVPGIATTDPSIISEARSIAELSFDEAAEMAVFGAKVLHPATLWPAIRADIPVFVGSSREPETDGTWIRPSVSEGPSLRAVAVRRNQKLVTVTSLRMLHSHGFLARIFTVLAQHGISVDMVTTSEISVSLTLDQPVQFTEAVADELRGFAQVTIEDNLTLLALVGNRLNSTPGMATRIFALLEDVNIRVISQGAGDHSLGLLVPSDAADGAVRRLHRMILDQDQPETSTPSAVLEVV